MLKVSKMALQKGVKMKKILKIIPMLLICGIAFVAFMCAKAERDYDTKYKQIIHGEKRGNDMQYCNSRANIGMEDYTSCMHRMSENYK